MSEDLPVMWRPRERAMIRTLACPGVSSRELALSDAEGNEIVARLVKDGFAEWDRTGVCRATDRGRRLAEVTDKEDRP